MMAIMKKYHLTTYGCQMNEAESRKISALLEKKGYSFSPNISKSDLVIVNMCSVRQSAVDRVFGLAEKLKKLSPKPLCFLTGCVLKKDKKRLSQVFEYVAEPAELFKSKDAQMKKSPVSYIPIAYGCDNFCSYCVVPHTRGREKSRPEKEILKEVKEAVSSGAKEIWLLGQNVNSFKPSFPKLLKKVNEIEGSFWVKFTSSHPKDLSESLIKAMKECSKTAKYLNLPLQSGDNAILKKMNRPYTAKKYKDLVKRIRKEMPEISLSTDVIVGFPGETEKQFNNTAKMFKDIKFDMAYINQYSPRHGTSAFKLKDDIKKSEKLRRFRILTDILKKTALENNNKYAGKTIKVLVLEKGFGKTEGNKTIKIRKGYPLNSFVQVKITKALAWGLEGK